VRVEEATVAALAVDLLCALSAPQQVAERVVESLMLADARGAHTHGLSLLPLYAELIRAGVIDPLARPSVSSGDAPGIARVDGNRAFGQLTAEAAVDRGLALLKRQGVVAVGIRDGTHLGRLGEWAERAAGGGAAFLAFTNTSGGALNVAGPNGAQRVLSTNPVAIGIPTFGALAYPVVVDFASSQVSGSRIREVANAGGRLNPDWVVAEGDAPADDPAVFLSGHAALRPLGGASAGHKGFALMVASEMLAALAGSLMAGERDGPYFSNGALFVLLDISQFAATAEWAERVLAFRDYLEERGCRLPGSRRAGSADGARAVVADHVLAGMLDMADTLGVDPRGLSAEGAATAVTRTW
jgi:uncharacterized oxidoreductase